MTIPREKGFPHLNFREQFGDTSVAPLLERAQHYLDDESTQGIVLNFENCQWFDLLPLARLLALLCCSSRKPTLYIIVPSLETLPWHGAHVQTLTRRLDELKREDKTDTLALREQLQSKIKWFSGDALPSLRRKAGAFLLGWGVFDLLEERYGNCRWYLTRSRPCSLAELRQNFLFAYGSTGTHGAISDRIWPFTKLGESEQKEIMARLNGEELLAGPLRTLAKSKALRSGAAPNIFFYEPVENVFLHAYPDHKTTDGAIISMRVVGTRKTPRKTNRDVPRSPWRKLTTWESSFFARYRETPFLEMVVVDAGVGIPSTLQAELEKDLSYKVSRGINSEYALTETTYAAWETIRYAFEEHSGRRPAPPPGLRGLSWVKSKLLEYKGGMIEVQSQGASFVLWSSGESLVEIPWQESSKPFLSLKTPQRLRGTAVRLLLPLQEDPATPSRFLAIPQNHRKANAQTLIFREGQEQPRFHIAAVPNDFSSWTDFQHLPWKAFLNSVAESAPSFLIVLDLAGLTLSRGILEGFFDSFLSNSSLHGRLILINCSRHMTSRFDTVSAALRLENERLIIPFFDPDLALYLVGSPVGMEAFLLQVFGGSDEIAPPEFRLIAEKNRGLFQQPAGTRPRFSFDLSHVEALVRRRLGERLQNSLAKRGALNQGRFILPLSQHTVPLYVEPHQIFVDPELATELCRHLALLLRRRYREHLSSPDKKSFRVLTATRIGRDISMWMPEGFPRQVFVFFDSHLVRPEKPRLQKHLQDMSVVIVVDIISSGTLVSQLLTVCHDAGAHVLGVVSLINFSPPQDEEIDFNSSSSFRVDDYAVEHLTFWRSPQHLLESRSDDVQVDPVTLSISPPPLLDDISDQRATKLEREQALRFLADAQILHYGHFDLFGRHNEFATNLPRLFSVPSYLHDEVCRACEEAIFDTPYNNPSVAIVLYPDLSHCHLLQAALAQRPKLRQAQKEDRIRMIEARRASRAFGRRYWLTNQELEALRAWASQRYADGYSVLLLDDAASSGETLLALLELARALAPSEVHAFVIQNRMPQFRTGHHEDIQRFAWASSRFSGFLSLNLPTFTRENCPLCRERSELAAEQRVARGQWLREGIQHRLDRLEIVSTLNAHDLPEGPLAEKLVGFRGFDWDEDKKLGSDDMPAIIWAISARQAIYRGIGLLDIFESISSASDDVWRLTVIEIARRNDLQQAQRVEDRLIERLRRVLQDGRSRRSTALEALRLFRPETLLPQLEKIVETTLEGLITDDVLIELYLLLRRVLSYRHLQAKQVVEQEASIGVKLDELQSREPRRTLRHTQLERLRGEWSNLSSRQDDLFSVVRDLDALLNASLGMHHQLTSNLRTYLPKANAAWEPDFTGYLYQAFKAIRLAEKLPPLLETASVAALDEEFREIIQDGSKAFEEFRTRLVSFGHPGTDLRKQDLTDLVDKIQEALTVVVRQLQHLILEPVQALREAVKLFEKQKPTIRCAITITDSLPPETRIFLDPALFRDIITNISLNFEHAIDSEKRLEATLRFLLRDALGDGWVELRISCRTRAPKDLNSAKATTTGRFVKRARFFGADHYVHPDSWVSLEHPWEETWSFRRIGS